MGLALFGLQMFVREEILPLQTYGWDQLKKVKLRFPFTIMLSGLGIYTANQYLSTNNSFPLTLAFSGAALLGSIWHYFTKKEDNSGRQSDQENQPNQANPNNQGNRGNNANQPVIPPAEKKANFFFGESRDSWLKGVVMGTWCLTLYELFQM